MTRFIGLLLLASALLAGCSSPGQSADDALCSVAATLAAADRLVEQAITLAAGDDLAAARGPAGEARSLAEQAHEQLQAIKSREVREGAVWQALLPGYLHVAQAANALLSTDARPAELARSELTTAGTQHGIASVGLSSRCPAAAVVPGG